MIYGSRHRIWMKAVTTALVCLFFAGQLAWTVPADAGQSTLSRWLLLQALTDERVDDPQEVMLEAVTGMEFIKSGKPTRVANSVLEENYSATTGSRRIEFLDGVVREQGAIKVRFKTTEYNARYFELSQDENGAYTLTRIARVYENAEDVTETETRGPNFPRDGPYLWHGTRFGLLRDCLARDGLYGYTPRPTTPEGHLDEERVTVTGQRGTAAYWAGKSSRQDMRFETDYEKPTMEMDKEDALLSDGERGKEDKFDPIILEFKAHPLMAQFNNIRYANATQKELSICGEMELWFYQNDAGRATVYSQHKRPVDLNLLSFRSKYDIIARFDFAPEGLWYQWMDEEWMVAYQAVEDSRELSREEEALLSAQHSDEESLFIPAKNHLKEPLVNMHIGLRMINWEEGGQLEKNIETIARMIAWHNMLGMEVRYILEGDTPNKKVLGMLREKLGELSDEFGIDKNRLLSRVGDPFEGEKVIKVVLEDKRDINTVATIGDREYIVALKDDINKPGTPIPNYTAAASIGLALSALRFAKERNLEQTEYEQFREKMFEAIHGMYTRFGVISSDDDFMMDDLEYMVSGCSKNKMRYTMLYALPPLVKDLVTRIDEYHRKMHIILQAA